jgi:DME family drug/metabolite transporter
MALAVLGLFVFTAGDVVDGGGITTVRGLAVACLASAAFLLMTTASRELTRAAGPVAVAGAGLSLSALSLLGMLPLIGSHASPDAGVWDWSLIGLILYLGLGPTALAYLLYCSGMARCRSANLGLIASMVEPALAGALAWLLLSEQLTASEAAGCAIVMIAMVLLCESERRVA